MHPGTWLSGQERPLAVNPAGAVTKRSQRPIDGRRANTAVALQVFHVRCGQRTGPEVEFVRTGCGSEEVKKSIQVSPLRVDRVDSPPSRAKPAAPLSRPGRHVQPGRQRCQRLCGVLNYDMSSSVGRSAGMHARWVGTERCRDRNISETAINALTGVLVTGGQPLWRCGCF